jgi:hypothetical protein
MKQAQPQPNKETGFTAEAQSSQRFFYFLLGVLRGHEKKLICRNLD